MAIFDAAERAIARAIARAAYLNPFLPERIAAERAALGDAFEERDCDWNVRADFEGRHGNVERLTERAGALVEAVRQRLSEGRRPADGELRLYEDAVLFHLYHRHLDELRELTQEEGARAAGRRRVPLYRTFRDEFLRCVCVPGLREPEEREIAHLFACLVQIRRAFHNIFHWLVGSSPPAARLRAAVWQSIFTHDLDRYRRSLYDRMADFTTLVVGPSGTGKELVARAIAFSRYVAFDPKTETFEGSPERGFYPVSLSALSPTLIESEIFGHRRGSFTGALEDHPGRLELCPPLGTVFLDEVGEIAPPIQVKLLRVLQTRTFERVGDTRTLEFHGKVIAATNRDLAREMREGRFRTDLYYRLCSDLIATPSLREQIASDPDELRRLTRFVARRVAGDSGDALADDVVAWIERELGPGYPWPGNFRELEQCVRNVLIRGEYRPPSLATGQTGAGVRARLAAEFLAGRSSAEDILRRYATLVYAEAGSYDGAARRLGLDRRTVRRKVDPELLEALRAKAP